jgi:hypothetical protein
MTRRRRKRNNDVDFRKLIVGLIFLLSFAYIKNMKAALHLGLIVLSVSIAARRLRL